MSGLGVSLGFVNNDRLRKCYEVCQKVNYQSRYLQDVNFCRRNFFSPLGPLPDYFFFDNVINQLIQALCRNSVNLQYDSAISNLVTSDPNYSELSRLKSEDILALGTVYYYLGNLYQLALYVTSP